MNGASNSRGELRMLMLNVSNMPSPDAPDGLTENDNVEVRNSAMTPTVSVITRRFPTGRSVNNYRYLMLIARYAFPAPCS